MRVRPPLGCGVALAQRIQPLGDERAAGLQLLDARV
jgi:hypothetical protein